MPFYVIGGMYEDTTFLRLVRPEPTSGPFDTYEEAAEEWSGRSRTTIDIATMRFRIVETAATPPAGGSTVDIEG